MVKWAFIAVSSSAEGQIHTSVLRTSQREITTALVPDYGAAAQLARQLVDDGAILIELCGGVGHIGAAQVAQAVPEVRVGVVRFDTHPMLEGKSGDEFFAG